MSALPVRLPDDKHRRLRELSKQRKVSISRLIDEMTTLMLADFDAETRFQFRAARGKGKTSRGLDLLNKAVEGASKDMEGSH